MHNPHLVIVEAENGEEACAAALHSIEDWGDGNNWRVACGAVNANGVSYSSGEGGYADLLSLKVLKEKARRWVSNENERDRETFLAVADALRDDKDVSSLDWHAASAFAKQKADQLWALSLHKTTPHKFDIFQHEYCPGEYATCGITQIGASTPDMTWCVVIDMHS